jgi:hypothetical protein
VFEGVAIVNVISEFYGFVLGLYDFKEELQGPFVVIDTGLMEFHLKCWHSKNSFAVFERLADVGPINFMKKFNFLDSDVTDKRLNDF